MLIEMRLGRVLVSQHMVRMATITRAVTKTLAKVVIRATTETNVTSAIILATIRAMVDTATTPRVRLLFLPQVTSLSLRPPKKQRLLS